MATIRCLLHEASSISAQQHALLDRDRSLHYLELENQVRRLAMLLANAGLGPGKRVALRMANSVELVLLLLAIPRTGAVAAPLSTRLPAAALLAQCRAIEPLFLITTRSDDPGLHPAEIRTVLYEQLDSFVEGLADPVEHPVYGLHEPHVIVFTSGSTSEPKPAVLSYGALYYSARGVNQAVGLRSQDKWLLTLPLYHVGGLGVLYRCLLAGATVVIPKPGEDLGEEIQLYNATHASVVPTQLGRLLAHPDAAEFGGQLKALLLGGAECPAALRAEAARRKWPVLASYGLTEMASAVTAVTALTPPAGRATSGKVLPGRELRLAPDGEILVRGPTLFLGYRKADGLHLPVDENGWYATGDLGSLDADGHLTVTGRKDNMFISGGENIHPESIERALCAFAGCTEAVVVPLPDKEFGHRPVAFVRTADPKAELKSMAVWLAPHLPKFQIPVAFYPLPLEEGLKVDRRKFAELVRRRAATPG